MCPPRSIAAFEISSTNRYTGTTFEAMIISRRDICEGEEIKYLCGTRAILTLEEEEDLDERSKNFSIIITTRNQATSLLAGPGRFANHDWCGEKQSLFAQ
jgi:[histone H4]-N-methyl-L-lysine20 N-methyltransferase